ncbi:hypothetical protein HGRIS_013820 [Hohenbuehelia grisea]|uniref:Indole-3-glycerol-phosphate synthase n=1 Tax=Hohenbuehelia grisea TaxID=104357 RepID=A0ABR3IWR1_9AGAR
MSSQSNGATATGSKPPSILERIYAQRARDVEAAKATPGTTPEDLATLLAMNLAPPPIPLVERLKRNPSSTSSSPSPSLMAEIKRASPSKGPIAMTTNAAQQALVYALSGASVISVLTEPTWFKGSLLDMSLVRQAVDALPDRPAILRKEFILDEYQIDEARLHGADTVLLIVAMLPTPRLQALYAHSLSRGMEPLVEVNNATEMRTALELGAKVIGVNNRNLHDFQVDMGTTSRLVEMVRERDVVLCALSGISNPQDVQVYKEQGVRAVLVGEALMRAEDTAGFIRELLAWPDVQLEAEQSPPVVKVSGVRSADEATAVARLGVGIIGVVLHTQSPYSITLEAASEISRVLRASRSINPNPSPSHTTPNEPWFTTHARNLAKSLATPLLVGIFHGQPLSEILHAIAAAQLDLVQVDDSTPLEWAKFIPVPVIRSFSAMTCTTDLARPGLHQLVQVDFSASPGGSLESVGHLVRQGEVHRASKSVGGSAGADEKWHLPVIASGLSEETLREAVKALRPWAVEGSEEATLCYGQSLDTSKLAAFIQALQEK